MFNVPLLVVGGTDSSPHLSKYEVDDLNLYLKKSLLFTQKANLFGKFIYEEHVIACQHHTNEPLLYLLKNYPHKYTNGLDNGQQI